jgi:hypothetical protein
MARGSLSNSVKGGAESPHSKGLSLKRRGMLSF